MLLLRKACTGVAWLSSARVVRCLVHSTNERNLLQGMVLEVTLGLPLVYSLDNRNESRRSQVLMTLMPRAADVSQC